MNRFRRTNEAVSSDSVPSSTEPVQPPTTPQKLLPPDLYPDQIYGEKGGEQPYWDDYHWTFPDSGVDVYPMDDGNFMIQYPDGRMVIVDSEGNIIIEYDSDGNPIDQDGELLPLEYDYNGDGVVNVQDVIDEWNDESGYWGENPPYGFDWPYVTLDSDGDGNPDYWYPMYELQPPYDLPDIGEWWFDEDGDGDADMPGSLDDPEEDSPLEDAGVIPWDIDGDGIPDFWIFPDGRVRPAGGVDEWGIREI